MRHVADAETDHGRVEGVVREGDVLGIALDKTNVGQFRVGIDLGPSGLDHGAVDVINHHIAPGGGSAGRQDGQIAGAAANIQHLLTGTQFQHAHGDTLPDMLDPHAQQGVHEIVLGRHAIEVAHHRLVLLALLERPQTETRPARGFNIIVHLFTPLGGVEPVRIPPNGHWLFLHILISSYPVLQKCIR